MPGPPYSAKTARSPMVGAPLPRRTTRTGSRRARSKNRSFVLEDVRRFRGDRSVALGHRRKPGQGGTGRVVHEDGAVAAGFGSHEERRHGMVLLEDQGAREPCLVALEDPHDDVAQPTGERRERVDWRRRLRRLRGHRAGAPVANRPTDPSTQREAADDDQRVEDEAHRAAPATAGSDAKSS